MKKKALKICGVLLAVLAALELLLQGYILLEAKKREKAPGNAAEYAYELAPENEDTVLRGKRIVFLGSSVTFGAAAGGQSFVEYLSHRDGVEAIKEAKSGTTLADRLSFFALIAFGNGESYVKRLQKLDPEIKADCVVVQLSTNDATMKLPLGEISDGDALPDFDTKTITGAMEYVIRYCKDTWNCPVVFYTGAYYESEPYAAMVQRLLALKEKWGIGVIDLYTNAAFNNINEETYGLYMFDPIHPTKAGYRDWWGPEIEKQLCAYLKGE